MFLSRVRLRPEAIRERGILDEIGDEYNVHRRIWSLFPLEGERRRDFLYRREYLAKLPTFYLLSNRMPEETAGLWHVETKPYEPKLRIGQKLSFVLRANPVLSRRDDEDRQHRHDVVMEAKTQRKRDGKPMLLEAEIVQEAGTAWLASRTERFGFSLSENAVRADGYCQVRFYRPKGDSVVWISTVDFSGVLTVSDTNLFVKALSLGIGPAKAFGCGLMLVKPK